MAKKNRSTARAGKPAPARKAARKPAVKRPTKPAAASPGKEGGHPRGHQMIVGIGASAGGLEAFQQFFSRMPADSGLAFVLVPHLDAKRKSALIELLQRETPMKVVEISDGMAPVANQVHVIPPNATLTMKGGLLRVQSPREQPLTIDPFLRSLAADQEDCAVGIILSGGGSDGTVGIRAVKEHGGLTMAQSGEGIRHDSMPHSAIATGLVDIAAPVQDMPAKLLAYTDHWRRLRRAHGEDGFRREVAPHLNRIYALLRTRTGHDFSRYKDSTFIRRVQRRMQVTHAATAAGYVELLGKDPREPDLLFKDLLIGVTQFFRDKRAFTALAQQVLPKIIEGKGNDGTIRVWVPGCATGEEAYSIAILLREQLAKAGIAPKVQIFATDLDADALDVARSGRYPDTIARDVSPERLERFFVRDGSAFRVTADLRVMCVFSLHNLIKHAPFSRLDLITCRNLLIYLDASLQNRVIPLFHFALRDGGYLFLGSSENIGQHGKLFSKVDAGMRLFRARPVPPVRAAFDLPLTVNVAHDRGPLAERPSGRETAAETIGRRAMRVVEAYAPAYVVIDEHYEMLHFSGRTGKYLQPTAGAANLNLFNILDSGLRSDVRAALHKAEDNGGRSVQESRLIRDEGETQVLNIIVEPLPASDGSKHHVVIFQDVATLKPPGGKRPARRDGAVDELEAELAATRERLQSTIEELETANEEMKASNEEFQSVNEELQSSNEELETSKEELQSLNEELETVNTELGEKVDSLERASNDRKNLLESTQIATLFIDSALRIKNFTPAVADIFNLLDSDVGRPITDIASRLAYQSLEADIRRVMRTLERSAQEVAAVDGSATYLMRILPYQTNDNVIDGVVITFFDITERKRTEESLARHASIVTTSHEAIIGLTEDATITAWNEGAERIYGYSAQEAIGQSLSLLIPPDRPEELNIIVERIKNVRGAAPVETVRRTKYGRLLVMASTISPIRNLQDKLIAASAIERDVTEFKRFEERQRRMIAELNHRVKNTLASVLSIAGSTIAGSTSLETFRVAFEGRIRALANAHDLLSRSEWSGADLRDIITTELEPYGDGHSLSIRGDTQLLNPSAALTFAMIVHELATNAGKYGGLSLKEGGVDVTWRSDGERLVLRWQERDGPKLAGKPARMGFGLRLIERSIANDLQGEANVEFATGGLRCTVDVPLAEVIARAEGPLLLPGVDAKEAGDSQGGLPRLERLPLYR